MMRSRYFKGIPVFIALVVLTVCMMYKAPVFATEGMFILDDGADLFTDQEESDLQSKITGISDKRDCDIGVITTGDLQGKDTVAYIDDAMTDVDAGVDRSHGAVWLLIYINKDDPADREVRIATSEKANAYFSDQDNDAVIDRMYDDLHDGNYASAAMSFVDSCDQVLGESLDGEKGSRTVSPFWIFGDLGIGAAIACALGFFQKSKLKSVKRRGSAAEYKAEGGVDFTVNKDTFIRKRVERRKIEDQDSGEKSHKSGTTHTTSSGEKHGGAGRKF